MKIFGFLIRLVLKFKFISIIQVSVWQQDMSGLLLLPLPLEQPPQLVHFNLGIVTP